MDFLQKFISFQGIQIFKTPCMTQMCEKNGRGFLVPVIVSVWSVSCVERAMTERAIIGVAYFETPPICCT